MKKCPPLPQGWKDFKSDLAQLPWKVSRPQGVMPPQRPTIPWGAQAHKRFNKIST